MLSFEFLWIHPGGCGEVSGCGNWKRQVLRSCVPKVAPVFSFLSLSPQALWEAHGEQPPSPARAGGARGFHGSCWGFTERSHQQFVLQGAQGFQAAAAQLELASGRSPAYPQPLLAPLHWIPSQAFKLTYFLFEILAFKKILLFLIFRLSASLL